jgi:hypothetical protein
MHPGRQHGNDYICGRNKLVSLIVVKNIKPDCSPVAVITYFFPDELSIYVAQGDIPLIFRGMVKQVLDTG